MKKLLVSSVFINGKNMKRVTREIPFGDDEFMSNIGFIEYAKSTVFRESRGKEKLYRVALKDAKECTVFTYNEF